jgi:chemotaxis methyl-accepting protein methylase
MMSKITSHNVMAMMMATTSMMAWKAACSIGKEITDV